MRYVICHKFVLFFLTMYTTTLCTYAMKVSLTRIFNVFHMFGECRVYFMRLKNTKRPPYAANPLRFSLVVLNVVSTYENFEFYAKKNNNNVATC